MESKIAIVGTILLILINSAFFLNYNKELTDTDVNAQGINEFAPVFYLQLQEDQNVSVTKNTKKKQKKVKSEKEDTQQVVAYNPLPPSPTSQTSTQEDQTVDSSQVSEDPAHQTKQMPKDDSGSKNDSEPVVEPEPEPVDPEPEPEPIAVPDPFMDDIGGLGG